VHPDDRVTQLIAAYGSGPVDLAGRLCDDHPAQATAAIAVAGGDDAARLTYGELRELSGRLAGALAEHGVQAGDGVGVLLPKSVELVVTLVALGRLGAVHVPLFTAFGPDAVCYRLEHSDARLLVAHADHEAKADAWRTKDPARHVVVAPDAANRAAGEIDFWDAIRGAPPMPERLVRRPDDAMILLYTSGTTGQPKGVEVPVRALASIHAFVELSLDLQREDVFWNIADPGWAYGLWYGHLGPLLLGHAFLVRSAPFDPAATYATLARHRVTNFTGAPTVYRALRAHGVPPGFREESRLRALSSAGEPLDAGVVRWGEAALGIPIADMYGQSELGMVVGNHLHRTLRRPIRPGSMGWPLPGYRVIVLDDDGRELGPGEPGQVAIDVSSSPLHWFRGYRRDAERTRERFPFGPPYFVTGDGARLDGDGYVFFASRADDVITSAGYRIGPFEVESALASHPLVAECAAIGVPDPLRTEVVAAMVVLAPGAQASDELAEELKRLVKSRLSAHAYPRHVRFVPELPKTPSGKIQRKALRDGWAL